MRINEYFGENVFSKAVMKQRLPREVYEELDRVEKDGGAISMAVADVVAKAMMDWAVEKGATHYTHWFQPL
ncbi:MAG: glutamine synthetase III, partial [Oscillospiraceae bacterium]|nr:glutamine synthetase III [Oscillospiraceae bacterium]